MRFQRLRLELRMELAADEPGMVGGLNNLDIRSVRRPSGNFQTCTDEGLLIIAVEFVTMPVALADFERPIGARRKGSGLELAGPRTEPHRPAHLINSKQFAQLVNHPVRCLRIEFRAVRLRQSAYVARIFYRGALHPQANPQKRNLFIARITDGVNHALYAALPESAGHKKSIHIPQPSRRRLHRINLFGLDPFEHRSLVMSQTPVHYR